MIIELTGPPRKYVFCVWMPQWQKWQKLRAYWGYTGESPSQILHNLKQELGRTGCCAVWEVPYR